MEKKEKLTPELLDEIMKVIDFPETKQIGDNIYEFRSGNFVVRGNKKLFDDVDQELLKMLKIWK